MRVEDLKTRITALLRELGLDEAEIRLRENILAGYPRATWDRQVGKYRRYVQFTPLDDEFAGRCGLLYGQWVGDANGGFGVRDPEQFDSRSLGDLDYCVEFVRAWLVETRDWRSLPPMRLPSAPKGDS